MSDEGGKGGGSGRWKVHEQSYLAVGLVFLVIGLSSFATGNTGMIAFVALGITFFALAFQEPKKKPEEPTEESTEP